MGDGILRWLFFVEKMANNYDCIGKPEIRFVVLKLSILGGKIGYQLYMIRYKK
jgi:hypothetical protein